MQRPSPDFASLALSPSDQEYFHIILCFFKAERSGSGHLMSTENINTWRKGRKIDPNIQRRRHDKTEEGGKWQGLEEDG